MRSEVFFAGAVAGLVFGSGAVLGQTAHYPAGVEGIKAASIPPPGLYLRDYNYSYYADSFPGGPDDVKIQAYVQAPRLIYVSELEVLGGNYVADALIEFVYKDIKIGNNSWDKFGLGDALVEPLILAWHEQGYDLALGYGFWIPTGDFDVANPASSGSGYWGHMLTAGATVFLDDEKLWSVSVLNRYEINLENPDTDIETGNTWTMEYGVGYSVTPTVDVGVAGYYAVQTTDNRSDGPVMGRAQLAGMGPEVSVFWPSLKLFTGLRYAYEFEASNRPRGHMLNLILTKVF
jgi:hypothetical protein